MKNSRISIKVDQEYRTSIEEKTSQAGLTISAYIRYGLNNIGLQSYTNKLMKKTNRSKNFNKPLINNAISQNTVEAQRLQLEEAKRPQPLLARLKAVFVPE